MKYSIAAFLFAAVMVSAQQKSIVKDSITNKPIAYAGVFSNRMYMNTSADVNGNFGAPQIRNNDTLIFYVPGYTTKKVRLAHLTNVVFLSPIPQIPLSQPIQKTEKHAVNDATGKHTGMISISNSTSLLARFIAYEDSYALTPFLKSIRFSYLNKAPEAIFKVRFFEAGPDGKPGNEIATQNIIYNAQLTYLPSDDPESDQFNKGDESLDLTGFAIAFPKSGLFVAVETMSLEQNTLLMGPDKMTGPAFSTLKDTKGLWQFQKGKWKQDFSSDAFRVQLTLTN